MIQDKTLPQAIDAEETVIGTLLAYPESINNIIAILTPEMFYKSELQLIYKCCLGIIKKFGTIDLITLTDELRKKGIIENYIYLVELSGRVITDRMIENHALLIKEKYLLRRYIKAGDELSKFAYTGDLADVAEKAEMAILNISNKLHTKEPKKLGGLINDVISVTDKLVKKEISLIGVPSGFTKFDRLTGGFKKKQLIIIAGRPSIGKTALALQIAKNAAELYNPVGIFSCEMSEDELARRFVSGVSGRSNVELISGRCEVNNLLTTSEPLLKLEIYIDDTSAISLLELRAKARKLILKFGIKMIIVDYLQLLTGVGQNREQEISYLSRGLKSIAKDLDIPVIALSQLNRLAESRVDRKPQLADLRESGAIEQDADIVMLLHRPGHYGIKTANLNNTERSTDGLIVINLAKNRNGATGELGLIHNESMTQIIE
jgi:replicative DNA helicase